MSTISPQYYPFATAKKVRVIRAMHALRDVFEQLSEDDRIQLASEISREAHMMKVHARATHSDARGACYSEDDFERLMRAAYLL